MPSSGEKQVESFRHKVRVQVMGIISKILVNLFKKPLSGNRAPRHYLVGTHLGEFTQHPKFWNALNGEKFWMQAGHAHGYLFAFTLLVSRYVDAGFVHVRPAGDPALIEIVGTADAQQSETLNYH